MQRLGKPQGSHLSPWRTSPPEVAKSDEGASPQGPSGVVAKAHGLPAVRQP